MSKAKPAAPRPTPRPSSGESSVQRMGPAAAKLRRLLRSIHIACCRLLSLGLRARDAEHGNIHDCPDIAYKAH